MFNGGAAVCCYSLNLTHTEDINGSNAVITVFFLIANYIYLNVIFYFDRFSWYNIKIRKKLLFITGLLSYNH